MSFILHPVFMLGYIMLEVVALIHVIALHREMRDADTLSGGGNEKA